MGTITHGRITVSDNTVENVTEFCYIGSIIQDDSSCDKDIRARLGKASGVFGRLTKIWRDNGLSTHTQKSDCMKRWSYLHYCMEQRHGP